MSGTINLGGILNPANVQPVAPPPPPNLLGMAAQGAQLQSQLYQNALTGQTLTARTAIGQAYQQAADPKTGAVDYGKLQSLIQQDPRTSYLAPQVMQGIQEQEKRQYELNALDLNQTNSRTGVANSAFIPLLRLGANVTPSDIFSVVGGLHAAGIPTDAIAGDMQATLPVMDPNRANDPAYRAAYGQQLAGWVADHAGRAMSPDGAAHLFSPNVSMVDTGGTINPTDTNIFSNPGVTSVPIGRTFSPSEASTPVSGPVGPNGAPTTISRAEFAASRGLGGLIPGGSPFGSGRPGGLPPSLLNPNRSPAGGGVGGTVGAPGGDFGSAGGNGSAGASPASPLPMPVGLGPAQTAALDLQGREAGTEAAALTSSAADIPNRKAMLSSMESDLANAPTGPSSATDNYWSAFANKNFGDLSKIMPWIKSPADVASYENFEKMAGRFAQSQAQALGGVATGDKLSAATLSNPNVLFSTLGNQGVIHLLQGNEDALNVKNQAWNAYISGGGDPSKFQQWSSTFNNSGFDPRVFWMKNMTPAERSRTLATFTPTQAGQFYDNLRTAMKNGWVSRSDFGGAPASPAAAGGSPDTGPSAVYPTGAPTGPGG